MAFRLLGGQREESVGGDAENAKYFGLVLKIIDQRVAQAGNFRVVEAQGLRLFAGNVGAVEHLEVYFRSLVETRDVDEDLVSRSLTPQLQN